MIIYLSVKLAIIAWSYECSRQGFLLKMNEFVIFAFLFLFGSFEFSIWYCLMQHFEFCWCFYVYSR